MVLLGGNYVFKTQPYFPPKEIVSANALEMAEAWAVESSDQEVSSDNHSPGMNTWDTWDRCILKEIQAFTVFDT